MIPTDPWWLPDGDVDAQAIAAGHLLAPGADKVLVKRREEPVFWDAGENFERVLCPGCGSEVPIDWWRDRMFAAWDTGCRFLEGTMPCCGIATSLNDLVYEWPQGFARWVLEIMNPARGFLTDDEIERLARMVGHSLREIWTHI